MIRKLTGLLFLLCALGVFAGTVAVEIAWLGFCFGTVIIGILLLFFAPGILFFPVNFGFVTGMAIWAAGLVLISGDDDNSSRKLEKFRSAKKGEVDPQVKYFLQSQFNTIKSMGHELPVDLITVAYVVAVIKIMTRTKLKITQTKPIVHAIFDNMDRQVSAVFEYALDNQNKFGESLAYVTPIVSSEVEAGYGSFLIDHAKNLAAPDDTVRTYGANYIDSTHV
ncbi:hypothetical protein WDZ55_22370 [Pseudomonas bubulae]|uniref:hypothetical protein n=1 Tax=Pseudomonas bubulae TaxID=2316085 RepID=UPI00307E4073